MMRIVVETQKGIARVVGKPAGVIVVVRTWSETEDAVHEDVYPAGVILSGGNDPAVISLARRISDFRARTWDHIPLTRAQQSQCRDLQDEFADLFIPVVKLDPAPARPLARLPINEPAASPTTVSPPARLVNAD